MESLSKEQCIDIIKGYLKKVNNEDYALLLDGEWGCGKTYLYNNNIRDLVKKMNKKAVYISLYGISSIKEVEEKIYYKIIEQYFPDNKMIKLVKKGGKFLIEGAKIFKEALNELLPYSLPCITREDVINIMKIMDSYTDLVLIVDDLERCNMKLNTILGFINDWVEHKECQCIIIANQDEVSKRLLYENLEDKFSVVLQKYSIENQNKVEKIQTGKLKEIANELFGENNEYSVIKEKLIGITIYYKPDLDELYEYILDNMLTSKESKAFFMEIKRRMLEIFETRKCYNIRILRRTMIFCNQILNELQMDYNEKDSDYNNTVKNVVNDLTKAIIEKYSNKKIEIVNVLGIIDENSESKERFSFISKLIEQGYLDKKLLESEINSYMDYIKEYNSNPDDPINKLHSMQLMKENDIKEELDKIILKLQRDGYNVKLYPKIISLIVMVDEMGIKDNYLEDAVKCMENNIKKNRVKQVHLKDYDLLWEDEKIEYKKAMKRVSNAIEKNGNVFEINKIIEDAEKWGIKLSNFVLVNTEDFRIAQKFLCIFDLDELVETIKKSDSENICCFIETIQNVYRKGTINMYFKDDYESLRILCEKLKGINTDEYDKVKQWNIRNLIKNVELVINMKIADR